MTQFDDHFKNSFARLLDHYGENVTYLKPHEQPRSIRAIVDRQPGEAFTASGVVSYVIRVRVHNDSTLGISSSELDEGVDRIGLIRRVGKTDVSDLIIDQMLNAEAGVLVLKVA